MTVEADSLRARLVELRDGAIEQLAALEGVDAGLLNLVADTSTALSALDTEAIEAVAPALGDRAIVVDDNATVQIVIFSADRQAER